MKRPIVAICIGGLLLMILTVAVSPPGRASGERVVPQNKGSIKAEQNHPVNQPHDDINNSVETAGVSTYSSTMEITGLEVPWLSINGGGDIPATSTNLSTGVSVGQAVAGEAVGPTLTARLGFWYCDCGTIGDMNGDDLTNPVDVVYLVNCVYRNQCALTEPPRCTIITGDMDCSGGANPVDVVYLVNCVYRSQCALCDGCNP